MTPDEWFSSIPWVTRRFFVVVLVVSILQYLSVLDPFQIALIQPLITYKWQFWRLFTSYTFFGPLSFPFLFTMAMLLQYGRALEGEYYAGSGRNRMDFLWTLFLGWCIFTPIFLFVIPLAFPAPVMISYIGYLWSRKDPFRPISVYGFTLKAWHTPLIFILFDVLTSQPLLGTILAIFVGHFVHSLQNIVPQRYGYRPVKCPEFLLDFGDKWLSSDNGSGFDSSPVQQAPVAPSWQRGGGHRMQ